MGKLLRDEETVITREEIKRNLDEVNENIEKACIQSGRKRADVKLLGVTKTVRPEVINIGIDEGLTLIGENRVQEYLLKKDDLNISPEQFHFIGSLQTNKVRDIVGEASMIHSVDSVRLGRFINRYSKEKGITTNVLVQINIGDEESKSGVEPEKAEEILRSLSEFENIKVKGLMAIPPIFYTEKEKREIFSKMYKLFIDIKDKNIDNITMDTLSMGMSGDYREAILEGATTVRIGSAIFGKRS